MKVACVTGAVVCILLSWTGLAHAGSLPFVIPGWCPGDTDGVYPDPQSCQTYLNCADTGTTSVRSYRQYCPRGLLFNPEVKYCDWAQNVQGCSPEGKPTTSPKPASTVPSTKLTTKVNAEESGVATTSPKPASTVASTTLTTKVNAEESGMSTTSPKPASTVPSTTLTTKVNAEESGMSTTSPKPASTVPSTTLTTEEDAEEDAEEDGFVTSFIEGSGETDLEYIGLEQS